MKILDTKTNDLNFGLLRIRIKGKPFKKHPEAVEIIRNAIRNDENISDFFSKHNGKIVVTAKEKIIPVSVEYPSFLARIPHETFTSERRVPSIAIRCTYSRAFALRNLFRKPVWINSGTRPSSKTTWQKCLDDTLELIKTLGKDTPENMKKRGDLFPRDLASVEARRLKVEKP